MRRRKSFSNKYSCFAPFQTTQIFYFKSQECTSFKFVFSIDWPTQKLGVFHKNKRSATLNDCFFFNCSFRHGILRERASVAPGRFVADCGRKCGIPYTYGVEANIWKGFHKKTLFHASSSISS